MLRVSLAALAALALLAPGAMAAGPGLSLSLPGLHVSVPAAPLRDPRGIEVGTARGDLLQLRNPALPLPGATGLAPQSASDAAAPARSAGPAAPGTGTPASLGPAGPGLGWWVAVGLVVLGLALALHHRRAARRRARMDARIAALRAELVAREHAPVAALQPSPVARVA